ncbi:MAG: 6-phosphogluconolactonase [Candidatus Didemnitutus sp.]|nr:6-phosphogluconolactonase [Candidatus Didemnitutus sp.]
MKELSSSYGRVFIGTKEDCFRTAVFVAEGQRGQTPPKKHFTWALTGGSTPKEWYQWCVAKDALSPTTVATTHWFVSDERYVRPDSFESNFGNADRLLLKPLGIPPDRKHPWSTGVPPAMAALEFGRINAPWFGRDRTFDVCFAGMGDDGHTLSLFPGSPLLRDDGGAFFAAIDVPGRGWRLTLTPSGLKACGLVVIMVLGAGKADTLHRVLAGEFNPQQMPAQVTKSIRDKVVWLVDEDAAAKFLAG